MTRLPRRTLLAAPLIVGSLFATTPAARAAEPENLPRAGQPAGPRTAYVDVSVATLWVEPGRNRPVDLPATTNPADLRAWTAGMTLAERRWLIGDLETQATYGQRVIVLEESGDWAKVVVPGQPTPRHELGYPGWLPKVQLTDGKLFARLTGRPFALVQTATAWLFDDHRRTRRVLELSFNTRLPVLARLDRAVLVATPSDGMSWLAASDVSVYTSPADIPTPTGADLVRTIGMFIGLPYLWAGTAGFGFDCSGLTHSVYAAHGITIPRDAQDQANAGTPVTRDQLAPGDLVFYARSNGTGRVHHVGMYAGDGYVIDAPTNTDTEESGVEYVKLDEHRYAHEYAGARRYL
ncbi:C40 family peptidase [Plantactinospora soyae]|uniref:Cell wall-associated NlpC family hydrolase n=1 Tax=Plantactinospora soyae TaxID=1544732 RepID=A0A927MGS3_9ACTN|nr:C40 family peptidase [Plantactinospora soyae]MBE1491408.1 cell wall-associated NlpC family hydrolase [Plantactinospora soyae]